MVRIGKKEERRARSPRKRKYPSIKTGPKKDDLPLGYKEHNNTAPEGVSHKLFIPLI